MNRRTAGLSIILGLAILLAATTGCGGPPSSPDGGQDTAGGTDRPELTDELIRERINFAFIRDIPEENGASEPIGWRFHESEPKEITIVEKKIEGDQATVVLDIKTTSSPRSRNKRYLAGQIRTEWQLRTGWVLRQWEVVDTENISMKFRDLPKTPEQEPKR